MYRWLLPSLLVGALTSTDAHADDWCRPDTVESTIRRWGTASYVKKKEYAGAIESLRQRLAGELLGVLAGQIDARYQSEILAQTSRVQTLTTSQRKVKGAREVCVVVQMDKGGLLSALPSDVGKALLAAWHDPIEGFAQGRPIWIREVALRDGAAPEFDDVVIPRIEDIIRRTLTGMVRWEPSGGATPPPDVVTFDVRVTPYPGYYAAEGVLRDVAGRSISVGAELARAWLGDVGARQPLSSRSLHIAAFDAPPVVYRGDQATLTWDARNARSCQLAPGSGDVPTQGTLRVAPTQDTTYKLTCADSAGGVVSREVAVAVRVRPAALNAEIKPKLVLPGGATKVSWTGSGVTGCSISPGVGPVGTSGDLTLTVQASTTWTISCAGEDGSTVVKTVSVAVGQPVEDPVPAVAPPTQPAPEMITLRIRSLDDDWLRVRVDGLVVAELYNNKEAEVQVSTSRHVVAVLPFMEDKVVQWIGIDGYVNGVATVGVSLDKPVVCYDVPICVKPERE